MLQNGGKLQQFSIGGILSSVANTYLDIWTQQEAAKSQERVLRAQAELERARAEALKAAQVAEEEKGIDILPILIIGAILFLSKSK